MPRGDKSAYTDKQKRQADGSWLLWYSCHPRLFGRSGTSWRSFLAGGRRQLHREMQNLNDDYIA